MDFLQNHIEALVFCSPSPVKIADLKACLSEMFNAEVPEEDILGALQRLEEKSKGKQNPLAARCSMGQAQNSWSTSASTTSMNCRPRKTSATK